MFLRPSFLNCLVLIASSIQVSGLQLYHAPTPVKRSIADGQTLRILPMGDSITWGYYSSDGNGYRLDLLNLLAGNPVTYIGSQHSGNMSNNANEGYRGATIQQISNYVAANGSYALQPNVVLLLAGTNDINLNQNVTTAPARLGHLIDSVLSSCTNPVVLVGEITPIWGSPEARVVQYNAAIPGIVAERVALGEHVLTVNMSAYITADDLADGLHPQDEGYVKMAKAWYAGIQQAGNLGWIEAPVNVTAVTSATPSPSSTIKPSEGVRGKANLLGMGLCLCVIWGVWVVL